MINALGAAPTNNKSATTPLNRVDNTTNINPTLVEKAVAINIPKAKNLDGSTDRPVSGAVKINPKLKNFGKKKKINTKVILSVLFLILLLVGGGVGLYLTKIKQDLRQQAACPWCTGPEQCPAHWHWVADTDSCGYTADGQEAGCCTEHAPTEPPVIPTPDGQCIKGEDCTISGDSWTSCTGITCTDPACGTIYEVRDYCRGRITNGNCQGCLGSCSEQLNKIDSGDVCDIGCGCVEQLKDQLIASGRYRVLNGSCHYPDEGLSGPLECSNVQHDFVSTTVGYMCHNMWEDGRGWYECVEEPTETPTPTATSTPTPTSTSTPTPTSTSTPTPTGTLTPTPTGTLTPTPTGTIVITNTPPPGTATPVPPTHTPVPPTATLPPGAPTYTPVPPTATIAYNYTPAPTTAGCNSPCTENSTCTAMNPNWICFENRCRLDVNPESPYCDYPQELLETGPKEWLHFLKVGLGMIGAAALLLLLL